MAVENSKSWMPQAHDLNWTRASFCNMGSCVEVAVRDSEVLIRDGKQIKYDTKRFDFLSIPMSEFKACIQQLTTTGMVNSTSLAINRVDPHTVSFSSPISDVSLTFDNDEFTAFELGALNGEFTDTTSKHA